MSRVCKIILVCEGWRDSAFARGFLEAAGVDSRSLDLKMNPGGSGHDWVKTQFVQEAANLARFAEGRGVLGLLDEDGQGAAVREKDVADRLRERELGTISARDGRCLLLPARNLETWLHWLIAQQSGSSLRVDETTDYKNAGPPGSQRVGDEDCRPAGKYLHSLNHTQPPDGCPSMLARGLGQLRDFLSAVRR